VYPSVLTMRRVESFERPDAESLSRNRSTCSTPI
jgi:hypothetical protein